MYWTWYDSDSIQSLAAKIVLIFHAARSSGCPILCSGLLGGGAFRGNRPLTLMLHMLVKTILPVPLQFHLVVMHSFSHCSPRELQVRIQLIAEAV